MKRFIGSLLMLAVVAVSTAPQLVVAEGSGNDKTYTFTLNAQNSSGESGTATLKQDDGKVKVVLALSGAPADTPQPAHIHLGSCSSLGAIAYSLTNVVNGASETTLDVTLAALRLKLPLAINVHKSESESGTYVACGDLKGSLFTKLTFDPVCMQNAVDKRDTAVIAGFDAYHTSVSSALLTRKTALVAAWGLTDVTARNAAIRVAWKDYRTALSNARKTLRTARLAAWKQFHTDRRACKGPNNSNEANGQGVDATL